MDFSTTISEAWSIWQVKFLRQELKHHKTHQRSSDVEDKLHQPGPEASVQDEQMREQKRQTAHDEDQGREPHPPNCPANDQEEPNDGTGDTYGLNVKKGRPTTEHYTDELGSEVCRETRDEYRGNHLEKPFDR